MGHKIILCVNERGILLTSLCSGRRGSAAGGRGTWVSHHSLEKRVSAGPVCKPAEVPATGGLAKPQPLLGCGVWCSELVSLIKCTFMLVILAVASGEGTWSPTDAFVGGSSGDSGQGLRPGASNGEFLVCAVGNTLGQLGDGCLMRCCLSLLSWALEGGHGALVEFGKEFFLALLTLSRSYLPTPSSPPPPRAG